MTDNNVKIWFQLLVDKNMLIGFLKIKFLIHLGRKFNVNLENNETLYLFLS